VQDPIHASRSLVFSARRDASRRAQTSRDANSAEKRVLISSFVVRTMQLVSGFEDRPPEAAPVDNYNSEAYVCSFAGTKSHPRLVTMRWQAVALSLLFSNSRSGRVAQPGAARDNFPHRPLSDADLALVRTVTHTSSHLLIPVTKTSPGRDPIMGRKKGEERARKRVGARGLEVLLLLKGDPQLVLGRALGSGASCKGFRGSHNCPLPTC